MTFFNNIGSDNTAIGNSTNVNSGNYSNSTALGNSALITASNQVRIGNSDITSIGGYKAWTNISDGRVKKNIKTNVPGLTFINLLKPITYNLDLDAADKIVQRPVIEDKNGKPIQPSQEEMNARQIQQKVVCTGFIAQDVEASAKKIGYDFDGVDAAKNDKDLYGLRYSEFVVPLVKAVQELSVINDKKDSIIANLNSKVNNLQSQLNGILDKINSLEQIQQQCCAGSTGNSSSITTQSVIMDDGILLEQNIPNPFTYTTSIGYTLPQKFHMHKL